MKRILYLVAAIVIFTFFFLSVFKISAEETQSSNYKMIGVSFGSAGGVSGTNDGGDEYKLLGLAGEPISDDRFESTNYKALPGAPNVLVANVPIISCFETVTDGFTQCTDVDVNPDGMVMLCGQGGCYDRARFEIDTQNNPPDTLYTIQIKEVGDSEWSYIDGSTFIVEDISSHDINDFLTESSWESTASNFNILGLRMNTSYEIRAIALHGDFTQSPPGPTETATTANAQIYFDIDIADNTGNSVETMSPYSVNLKVLNPGIINTAGNLIWLDIGTNAEGGLFVQIEDDYNGLRSNTTNYTISSWDVDLTSVASGFGLVEYLSYETMLGPLNVESGFGNGGDIVGGLSTTPKNIYNTSGNPVYEGRAALYVKAKSDTNTPSESDYKDELTFTLIGTY
ncbi:hypothetical protein GF362_05375 [Candidatus Dojkabacteria bacterium]|nr:hypothetical protein [Candidatus Dojkabacteria bacterium]